MRSVHIGYTLAFVGPFLATLALEQVRPHDLARILVASDPGDVLAVTSSSRPQATQWAGIKVKPDAAPAPVTTAAAALTPEVRDAADHTVETAIMAEDGNDRVLAIQDLEYAPRELALAALIQVVREAETVRERQAAVTSLLGHGLRGDPGQIIATTLRGTANDPESGVAADAMAALAQLADRAP